MAQRLGVASRLLVPLVLLGWVVLAEAQPPSAPAHTPAMIGAVPTVRPAVAAAREGLSAHPASSALSAAAEPLTLTHGVASGDVTAESAVVWARASGPALLHVEYDTDPLFRQPRSAPPRPVSEATDYTATVVLQDLAPDTVYYYRAWLARPDVPGPAAVSEPQTGRFRTAPGPTAQRPVSFVFGGDLGGQRYCRSVDKGYAIFSAMEALAPDFFIALGDMIYADAECPAEGPDGWRNVPGDFPSVADPAVDWTNLTQLREVYYKHWRYNRADPHLQRFLARTPLYAQWDDHEVINDFGGRWTYWNARTRDRAGYPNLVAAGREAFFHYTPIARQPADPERIYRRFVWSADLELFLLDERSYRSRNDLLDTPANAKTLLGKEQLAWLKEGLRRSPATWKVVSGGVPLSIATGGGPETGRDSWARGTEPGFAAQTGFQQELLDLLRFLDEHQVRNLVWLAADVHFPAQFRYEIDLNGDGVPLVFHELIAGPLSAARGPGPRPERLDPLLKPTLLYGEGQLLNFGYVRLEPSAEGPARLIAEVRDETGAVRPGSRLELTPR
ncbi:MAG TPA: alkaline phosphatase D family protein [Chloroflexota bacterium]|nr:alkaline phosphatase D family protein [Chloroflexota bacterium]